MTVANQHRGKTILPLMVTSIGAGMVLTASMMSVYSWAASCETCISAGDGALGSLLMVAGVGLLALGRPVERWWSRRSAARFLD